MKKILIITNKYDEHVDYVIRKMDKKMIPYIRMNTEDFPQLIQVAWKIEKDFLCGSIKINNKNIYLRESGSVWFRKPKPVIIDNMITDKGMRALAEGEAEGSLEYFYRALYDRFWMNAPHCNMAARSKLYQLLIAKKAGFKIPKTLISNNPTEVKSFFKKCKEEMIIKNIGTPAFTKKNYAWGLYTRKVTKKGMKSIDFVKYTPCYLQENIPKKYEYRITVVGDKVFACEIHSMNFKKSKYDWRHPEVIEKLPHLARKLPIGLENKCKKIIEELGLFFGIIDLIMTPKNNYVFLEVNANGQWLWVENFTKMPISEAVIELLTKHC